MISVRTEPYRKKVKPITDVTCTALGREAEKQRYIPNSLKKRAK
jgi:hypothetical protein